MTIKDLLSILSKHKAIVDETQQGLTPLPIGVLDASIEDGFDNFFSQIVKRKIPLRPDEALYHAIGRVDSRIMDRIRGITLGDILELIDKKNQESNEEVCGAKYRIEDYDEPKYIRHIILIRNKDTLKKEGKHINRGNPDIKNTYEFTLSNGNSFKMGEKQVDKDMARINELIDDDTIVKVVKILYNGHKIVLLDQ